MATAPLPPANPEISGVAPQPAPLSEGARILNTFIAPSKTFTDLRRSAMWWAPFLLMVIVWVGLVYTGQQKVGFRKTMENAMQAQPKQQAALEQLPAAEREQRMETGAKFTMVFWYVFPALQLIILLIIATVLFATFKFAVGADVSFKASLAIVIFAGLPGVLKEILAIISLVAGASPDSFTFQNPVGTNIGYYLNPADSPFLYSLASSIDVFLIWTLALTAIGFTCISKVKRGTAFVIVFGWWAFFTLALSSLALLS
jgi:hypothetical protein